MLKKLHLKGVGPAPEMEVEFAERLTVITGDNGLGKSFILDTVWFALTGKPFGEELRPTGTPDAHIILKYQHEETSLNLSYSYSKALWDVSIGGKSGLTGDYRDKREFFLKHPLLYIGGDGSIGVCDPCRIATGYAYSSIYSKVELQNETQDNAFNANNIKSVFGKIEYREDRIKINGYITDFMIWIKDKSEPFYHMESALKVLSEDSSNPIRLIKAERIKINDPREIPIILTDSSEIPITIASAGIKRIVSFAYALVWLWQEHKLVAQLTKQPHSRALLLLIDEIETHLHPKWQRKILAAVLEVAKAITDDEGFQVQVICTTHSPIVLTGIEPHFDPAIDKLLDLQLTPGAPGERGTVELREVDWYKRGTVGNWLTSDMFNVSERSPEAEAALAAAAVFGDPLRPDTKPDRSELQKVDRALRDTLADTDRFLLRWEYLLEQRGWTSLLRGK